MNEQEMYEAVGQKQVALDNLNIEYDRLLQLLLQVVEGSTAREAVTVDIAGRKWSITPSEETKE